MQKREPPATHNGSQLLQFQMNSIEAVEEVSIPHAHECEWQRLAHRRGELDTADDDADSDAESLSSQGSPMPYPAPLLGQWDDGSDFWISEGEGIVCVYDPSWFDVGRARCPKICVHFAPKRARPRSRGFDRVAEPQSSMEVQHLNIPASPPHSLSLTASVASTPTTALSISPFTSSSRSSFSTPPSSVSSTASIRAPPPTPASNSQICLNIEASAFNEADLRKHPHILAHRVPQKTVHWSLPTPKHARTRRRPLLSVPPKNPTQALRAHGSPHSSDPHLLHAPPQTQTATDRLVAHYTFDQVNWTCLQRTRISSRVREALRKARRMERLRRRTLRRMWGCFEEPNPTSKTVTRWLPTTTMAGEATKRTVKGKGKDVKGGRVGEAVAEIVQHPISFTSATSSSTYPITQHVKSTPSPTTLSTATAVAMSRSPTAVPDAKTPSPSSSSSYRKAALKEVEEDAARSFLANTLNGYPTTTSATSSSLITPSITSATTDSRLPRNSKMEIITRDTERDATIIRDVAPSSSRPAMRSHAGATTTSTALPASVGASGTSSVVPRSVTEVLFDRELMYERNLKAAQLGGAREGGYMPSVAVTADSSSHSHSRSRSAVTASSSSSPSQPLSSRARAKQKLDVPKAPSSTAILSKSSHIHQKPHHQDLHSSPSSSDAPVRATNTNTVGPTVPDATGAAAAVGGWVKSLLALGLHHGASNSNGSTRTGVGSGSGNTRGRMGGIKLTSPVVSLDL
ncbi:hypothetical protein DL93DRAFT_2164823 [Clavulina sp. PMI_390]|nr:hypothetical protein DL93DRAFT_2164823 [Clavulina sp. PMI_390]